MKINMHFFLSLSIAAMLSATSLAIDMGSDRFPLPEPSGKRNICESLLHPIHLADWRGLTLSKISDARELRPFMSSMEPEISINGFVWRSRPPLPVRSAASPHLLRQTYDLSHFLNVHLQPVIWNSMTLERAGTQANNSNAPQQPKGDLEWIDPVSRFAMSADANYFAIVFDNRAFADPKFDSYLLLLYRGKNGLEQVGYMAAPQNSSFAGVEFAVDGQDKNYLIVREFSKLSYKSIVFRPDELHAGVAVGHQTTEYNTDDFWEENRHAHLWLRNEELGVPMQTALVQDVVGAADAVVIIQGKEHKFLKLYQPSTREWVKLPTLDGASYLGPFFPWKNSLLNFYDSQKGLEITQLRQHLPQFQLHTNQRLLHWDFKNGVLAGVTTVNPKNGAPSLIVWDLRDSLL